MMKSTLFLLLTIGIYIMYKSDVMDANTFALCSTISLCFQFNSIPNEKKTKI